MTEEQPVQKPKGITRRDFIKYASASAGITAALALANSAGSPLPVPNTYPTSDATHSHALGVAAPSQTPGGITPGEFLRDFYTGELKTDAQGPYREFRLTSVSSQITVARGVQFLAWSFIRPASQGATVPGPTMRCTQGERVQLILHNGDSHPHTIHMHGIHQALADGVFEVLGPGDDYPYTFEAEPFGLFLYHCHVMPVKKHISKGLYGAMIVDPATPPVGPGPRPTADQELVMVMNGFDVDFDDENEFYSVNGIANYYFDYPITLHVGELVRIYLVNMTEFDPVNSFHLHGNVFRLYRTGTRFSPTATLDRTKPLNDAVKEWLYADPYAEVTDTVFLGQGERAVIEFVPTNTGRFLFHAHQSEFIELGWTGIFNVV